MRNSWGILNWHWWIGPSNIHGHCFALFVNKQHSAGWKWWLGGCTNGIRFILPVTPYINTIQPQKKPPSSFLIKSLWSLSSPVNLYHYCLIACKFIQHHLQITKTFSYIRQMEISTTWQSVSQKPPVNYLFIQLLDRYISELNFNAKHIHLSLQKLIKRKYSKFATQMT